VSIATGVCSEVIFASTNVQVSVPAPGYAHACGKPEATARGVYATYTKNCFVLMILDLPYRTRPLGSTIALQTKRRGPVSPELPRLCSNVKMAVAAPLP
jgi:hypothetical protein